MAYYIPANRKKKDKRYFTVIRGKQCLNRVGLAQMKTMSKTKTYAEIAKQMGVASSTVAAYMGGFVKLASGARK